MREHRPRYSCDNLAYHGSQCGNFVGVVVAGVEVEERVWVLEVVIAFRNKGLAVVKRSCRLLTFSSLGPWYTAPTMGGALSTPH